MSTVSTPPRPAPAAGNFIRRWWHTLRRAGAHGDAYGRARLVGRLAVDALPDEWSALEAGKLYAIYAAPRTPGADVLIWESAREAHTRDVTVVLARERVEVDRRLRELGFSASAPASGWPRNLGVLAMPPVAVERDRDHERNRERNNERNNEPAADQPGNTSAVFGKVFGGLRALKRFGFRTRSLYFIEGAERWFNWDDAAALAREGRMLANWCAARKITLVLLLGSPSGVSDSDDGLDWLDPATSTDNALAQQGRNEFHAACAGVARMRRTHGELLWHVDFWRADRTLVTGEVRSLRFTEHGRLSVTSEQPGNAADGDGLLARDEQRVVVSRAAVRGHEAWVPPHWEVCADLAGVLAACVDAQAATVVLDYAGGAQLDSLCAAVHALRRQAGRALKIVIVERGEVLRHQYELLVLTLGANLVLGRDLPFSRMQSLLQSLQGQLHTRPIATDYRGALSAALSDDVLGYLPPGAFCERVRTVLDRSAILQLPHVLVKLTLLPECAHVDALRHCVPRRAGDVFTADAAHLYVFLFACRLADADAALARIFDVPVEQIADTLVHLAEQSIGDELKALETANRRARIADYSDLFAMPAAAHQVEVKAPAVDADATVPNGTVQASAEQLARVEEALARARADAEAEANLHADDSGIPNAVDAHGVADNATRNAVPDLTASKQVLATRQLTPPSRYAEPYAMPVRKTESR